jgi:hypothetical protein
VVRPVDDPRAIGRVQPSAVGTGLAGELFPVLALGVHGVDIEIALGIPATKGELADIVQLPLLGSGELAGLAEASAGVIQEKEERNSHRTVYTIKFKGHRG